MTQSRHSWTATQQPAATKSRTFRTFLLMSQLQAREIGARIALKRKERGLTQEELAAMASFSKRSLQDYENGVTIPYKHLAELGKLLATPSEWFMYGEDAAPADAISGLREEVAEIRDMLSRVLEARDEPDDTEPRQQAEDS